MYFPLPTGKHANTTVPWKTVPAVPAHVPCVACYYPITQYHNSGAGAKFVITPQTGNIKRAAKYSRWLCIIGVVRTPNEKRQEIAVLFGGALFRMWK